MNEKQKGGDLIGTGSYGCVFHPALKCIGQKKVDGDMVSKVFFSPESKKEAIDEMKIDSMIQKMKGNDNWAHIWEKNCLPKKYNQLIKEEPSISSCLHDNRISSEEFDKNRRMLQGTYAGDTLSYVFEKHFKTSLYSNKAKFTTQFLDMMRLMKPLFIGLIEMHKNGVSHNDIKSDNIMVDKQGCKYIDFGLAAKHSNTRFFKQRSMSEFASDRIYPSYPYEFIYLYATKDVLIDEKEDKKYNIYRYLHDRYQLVHETIFKRQKLKEYLLSLIDYHLEHGLEKDKQSVIKLIDTYSLGILLPGMLARSAKKHNKLNELKKLIHSGPIKAFMELFKDMSDPDHHERIDPTEAYRRYLELEKLYITKESNNNIKRQRCIKRA